MGVLGRFILATSLTNLADGIALIAWAWIASLLTRDPVLIALVPVALKAPWFLFSVPAGLIVDRLDRQRLILLADLLRTAAYAGAALAIWLALPFADPPLRGVDRPGLFALIGLFALLVGAAEVLRDNAAQTILPALVPPAALERANGRLWSAEMIANQFAGPALAGVLLAASPAAPLAVNALALALAAGIIARLRGDFAPGRTDPRPWRVELAEGWRFLIASPLLRGLALLTGFTNFAFEMVMIALILLVQERLGLGAPALAAIYASGAAGGVLAGLLSDRIAARLGGVWSLRWGLLSMPVFPLLVLTADSLWLLCLGFFVSEFFGIVWNTVSVSTRQRAVPRALLGRVNALYRLFALGMVPFGMVLSGVAVRLAEPVWGRSDALLAPFAIAAAVFVVMILAGWRFVARHLPR
ncbi:MFS transporter [Paracoccus sp. p4-l81]|uniref:MFS transporter n=1 Tax=unclassified Paracoccus (in: a-proteobacteria) TaxID=2688777 RepID=UPI0035B8F112